MTCLFTFNQSLVADLYQIEIFLWYTCTHLKWKLIFSCIIIIISWRHLEFRPPNNACWFHGSSFKGFSIVFLAPWLAKVKSFQKLNGMWFFRHFLRHICSAVTETIGVTNNAASFGAKNAQKTTFEAAEMMLGPWNQQIPFLADGKKSHDYEVYQKRGLSQECPYK